MKISPKRAAAFWSKVNRSGGDDACWEWQAACHKRGYGIFKAQFTNKAHRAAWVIHNEKPIPEGLCVCHTCDNPPCVNPAHLFLGTHQDNMIDRDKKGRAAMGRKSPAKLYQGTGIMARGVRIGIHKLFDPQITEIRRLYLSGGYSHRSLAKKYKVNHTTIGCILRGTMWRHVA